MEERYTIPLSTLIDEISPEKVYIPDNYEEILLTTPEVNRPGLILAGFTEHFESARIQILGHAEHRSSCAPPPSSPPLILCSTPRLSKPAAARVCRCSTPRGIPAP